MGLVEGELKISGFGVFGLGGGGFLGVGFMVGRGDGGVLGYS